MPERESKEIMNSIFGYQIEDTLYLGLIDSSDANDFQVKLEKLKSNWDKLCSGFYEWFVVNEAGLFCSSLIRSVRTTAGLGLPPPWYTTNNNESINRLLKEKVHYKKQEWPSFNSKMQQLVAEQQQEYSKAVCCCGEYELHSDYKHLEASQSDWSRMTPEQRKAKVEKLLKQSAKDSNSVTCSKDHSFHSVPTTLSIDWTKANISYLQPSRVEDLWTKAAKLLGTPGFVVSAAGNTSARQVASMSATDTSTPPHFVYAKKSRGCGTEVHCDCPVYSSTPKVCQHSLAAADDMGILSDYLAFLRKTKAVALNLSTLISNELPKSAGQKDSTSRRKGTPKGKKKPVLTEKDVLSLPSTSGNESHSINAENIPPESRFVPPVLPSTMPPFSPSPPYGYSGSFHFDQPFQPSCMNSYFSASPMPYHSSPVFDQVHTPSQMLN